MNYDPTNADLLVYVRRQSGTLLSSFGHDLKIAVREFTIDVDLDDEEIDAEIDATSLEPVDSIDWETRQETGKLSEGDRQEIAQNMKREVLEVDQYPEIAFESTSVDSSNGGWRVNGPLNLHGEARDINVRVVQDGDRAHAEATVDQTRFGIEPYSAMLGSLKVHPEVVVVVDAPLPSDV